MTFPAGPLETRLVDSLDATPAAVPLVVGGCGCGRTALLLRLRERVGLAHCQYVDVERIATTPERFYRTLVETSRFVVHSGEAHRPGPGDTRAAFDATMAFLQVAHAPGGAPAVFLLDEVLELRTFESFPGLRSVLPDLFGAIADSPNRFVLTTRFATRARRLVQRASPRVVMHQVPAMTVDEVSGVLDATFAGSRFGAADADMAQAIHALTSGHRGHVQAIAWQMRTMSEEGIADPLSALSALLAPGGRLNAACRFSYELRLHRARGYGALKAILEVLAEEQPLTLTAIAQRLGRTPGSTKDYLSWLEDVDLVHVMAKRYSYVDPMLRTWVRLYNRVEPPDEETLAREIHRFAIERMGAVPFHQARPPAPVRARAGSNIIEFD